MGSCVANGCSNRKNKRMNRGDDMTQNDMISFHRFPSNPELKEKWIQAIGRDEWQPTDFSRVCSRHFTDNDFDNSSPFRRYLKKSAIPSVFPDNPIRLKPSTSKTPKRVFKSNTLLGASTFCEIVMDEIGESNCGISGKEEITDETKPTDGLVRIKQEGDEELVVPAVGENGISNIGVSIKEEMTDETVQENVPHIPTIYIKEEKIDEENYYNEEVHHDGSSPKEKMDYGISDNLPTDSKSQKSIILNDKDPYQCFHCVYKTTYLSNLKRHIMYCHASEKPHKCPLCDYKTVLFCTLKRHIMALHKGEKAHHCHHCDYKTVSPSDLKEHTKTLHTGEKPYHCTHCDYQTEVLSNLRRHIIFRHTQEKPHHCPHCEYRTANISHLKSHIITNHTFEKPHHCPYCDYRTTNISNIKRHIKTRHTDVKPHQCPHCDYITVLFSILKQHIISRHTDKKSHHCPHCDYTTGDISNLKRHTISRHTDENHT